MACVVSFFSVPRGVEPLTSGVREKMRIQKPYAVRDQCGGCMDNESGIVRAGAAHTVFRAGVNP